MDANNKSAQNGQLILVLVAMVMGVLIGLMFSTSHSRRQSGSSSLQGKLDEVLQLVEEEYVDAMDTDSLSERIVAMILSELDPHSTYLSARETERTDEMMRGSFEGVGIVLHREGDTTYVGQVLKDGPSAGLGLLPGDMVVLVDGEQVSGCNMAADSVVRRLRGPRGSKVEVTVERCGQRHSFTIRRGVVDHKTLPYYGMLDDSTGYILLTSFASTSHSEFHQALRDLKGRGMRRLLFDLRGNGGGSLNAATGIAGELLPQGSPIVYTQGAHSRRRDTKARSGGLFNQGELVVLIDESSASASEVVAGALQDNDRATVVGRRSFGKGLVQTEFALSDHSSVLLTTARYYTPSGRCIQRPYTYGTDEYYRSYVQQLIDEAYADTAAVNDTTPYYTLGGRVVHGGGGITPDHILPYRKDSTFAYYNRLLSSGVLNRTAFEQVKQHAAELLQRYPTEEAFFKNYKVSDQMLQRAATLGEQADIATNRHSLSSQRRLIANLLKAYIGQSLYGDALFYRIIRQEDEDLQTVLSQKF